MEKHLLNIEIPKKKIYIPLPTNLHFTIIFIIIIMVLIGAVTYVLTANKKLNVLLEHSIAFKLTHSHSRSLVYCIEGKT